MGLILRKGVVSMHCTAKIVCRCVRSFMEKCDYMEHHATVYSYAIKKRKICYFMKKGITKVFGNMRNSLGTYFLAPGHQASAHKESLLF